MKYKENCTNCETKKGCKKHNPLNLQDTIECMWVHGVSSICERSNYAEEALEAITSIWRKRQ